MQLNVWNAVECVCIHFEVQRCESPQIIVSHHGRRAFRFSEMGQVLPTTVMHNAHPFHLHALEQENSPSQHGATSSTSSIPQQTMAAMVLKDMKKALKAKAAFPAPAMK